MSDVVVILRTRIASKFNYSHYPIEIDWSGALNGATISECNATCPVGGLVLSDPVSPSDLFQGAIQRVWISGGDKGPAEVHITVKFSDIRAYKVIADLEILD